MVVWIALGTVVVHVATGWRYGFDRDELMALEDARHLAWGYVQYPPMIAFFGRVALELFGTSLGGFRLFAAVAQAMAVVLTGLMAKELGGGKWAQVVAGLAAVPFCLGAGALMQYISFDYVCWVLVAWCTVRLLKSGDARWWVGIGAGIGLGMLAKYTMGVLALGIVAGVLLTRARNYLRSGWLWIGVAVSLAIFAPNFVWEWRRNFISLDFLRFLHVRDVSMGLTDWFLPGQLELMLLAFPLAAAGLWFYFFTEEGERYRLLGWMYVVALAVLLVLRGRDYYLAPAYPMLYAAGSVWVEEKWRSEEVRRQGGKEVAGRWESESAETLVEEPRTDSQTTRMGHLAVSSLSVLQGVEEVGNRAGDGGGDGGNRREIPRFEDSARNDVAFHGSNDRQPSLRDDGGLCGPNDPSLGWWSDRRWRRSVRRAIWVVLILDVVVAGAVALPIAPVGSSWWKFASQVDSVFPEEIGWPEFVEGVARVRDGLPAEERARVGILAGNYGEVGALNLYGERYGLPRAISGVNSSWERGYGNPPPEVLIVVGYPREFLEKEFASCTVAGRTRNRYGVANEETMEDADIFVCRGLKGTWKEFWAKARRFA